MLCIVGPQEQLFVVGDPAQAIYTWRGADPNNMRTRLPLEVAPLTQLSLTTNYRSVKPVLDEAARLWNRFPGEFPHHGKLQAHRREPAVAVKVCFFVAAFLADGTTTTGEPVQQPGARGVGHSERL